MVVLDGPTEVSQTLPFSCPEVPHPPSHSPPKPVQYKETEPMPCPSRTLPCPSLQAGALRWPDGQSSSCQQPRIWKEPPKNIFFKRSNNQDSPVPRLRDRKEARISL